jgi:2,3-bisphosphoglycerate-independent phosphoglycerate mutase
MKTKKRVVLIVLDGWGISKHKEGNAILAAHANYFNQLQKNNSHCTLKASEEFVGLKKSFIGNSEVGHLHIGAGRLVKQDLVRISDSIDDKSFFRNKALLNAMKTKGALHLLGLLSDAGVHSHIDHLFALLEMAKKNNVKQVFVHAITDGRDTPPKSALKYIKQLKEKLKQYNKNWRIATVIGRYYAMDRDNRWNREHKAYEAMVNCKGHHHKNAETAVLEAYNRGETDEFIYPTVVGEKSCNVKEGDSIIFFNFRSDRARELTRAFVQGKFNNFKRKRIMNLKFTCLTQYDAKINAPVAFHPEYLKNTLGEVIGKAGLRQFRLAETEKWAHVTYFFNGLSGKIFKNEDRLLIPSRKVRTYDLTPEMSAFKIENKAEELLNSKKYDFVLINFANPDMVGHTGDFNATVKAVKTTDKCLSRLVPIAQKNDYTIIITADHGNAEQKLYSDGSVCTAHTTNDVPFILVSEDKNLKLKNGALYNIAPTILKIMNVKKPREMGEGLV